MCCHKPHKTAQAHNIGYAIKTVRIISVCQPACWPGFIRNEHTHATVSPIGIFSVVSYDSET